MPNSVRIGVSTPGAKQSAGEVKDLRSGFDLLQKQGARGFAIGAGAAVTTKALGVLGGALDSVGDFMGTTLQRASDLAESQGKVNVVFGEGAKEVEAWAGTASKAFGQSKQQALEAAGTYGNLFQAFGVGADKSRDMSMALVELAADLASFNNTSIDDALLALRSGLSGETEPLKRYGIAISDARMRTELAAQGYKDLGATLTPLQKSMASYALIMKDSSLAQGDFARTADGAANSIRSNEAAIADLEAEIGQKAIPAQKAWLDLQKGALTAIGRGLDLDAARTRAFQELREQGIEPTAQAVEELSRQYRTADMSGQAFGGTIRGGLNPALKDLDDAAGDAAKPTGDLARQLSRLRGEAVLADDAIDDLSDTISDELFGEAITAGHIARLNETYRELIKDRQELDKGTRAYAINAGEIAENRQELFELQLQMKDKEGPQAVIDFLRKQKKLYGDATGAIQRLIDKYRTLSRIQGSLVPLSLFGGKIDNLPQFAEGGRPKPGKPSIVGEEGPELFIPDSAGTIIPNDKATAPAMSAGAYSEWAGVTINGGITVTVTGGPTNVGTGHAVRQGIHDAMADVLRQQTARLPSGVRS